MATEKLKFNIELFSEYWDQAPTCEVLINSESKWAGTVDSTKEKPTRVEFEHELEEGAKYQLILNRQGKSKGQTVVDDQGNIIKDQLLHIKYIEIDEIDIGPLVFEGVYKPEYPEPWAGQQKQKGVVLEESFKNVTGMGHNGTWTFSFESPFYMWLLENLY